MKLNLKFVGIAIIVILAFALPWTAKAHYVPGKHNAIHAIQKAWCGKSNVSCENSKQAVKVADCESHLLTWASNGQYLGLFQMGSDERRIFGHGIDPWSQAFAAKRYWNYSVRQYGWGWTPWECQP